MPMSSPYLQRSMVQDNGRSLVPVPNRSGILLKRTVHKEFGTISRKRCCWNLPKAHVQFSVLPLHCPEVNIEAKDMEKLSIHFAGTQKTIETLHNCFLRISSVFTEQSRTCVNNVNPFTIDQGNLIR